MHVIILKIHRCYCFFLAIALKSRIDMIIILHASDCRHPQYIYFTICLPVSASNVCKQFGLRSGQTIMPTSPCDVYPLTPHFYIVKLGFTWVYFFSLFLLQNIDWEAVLTCTHNLCFEQKYENYYNFSSENNHFNSREILQYIARTCLRNVTFANSLDSDQGRQNIGPDLDPVG